MNRPACREKLLPSVFRHLWLKSARSREGFTSGWPPGHDELVGLGWHHARHARVCIERRRWWQAEHWISAVRDQVVALACLRLGHATAHAKGAHLLPGELTTPLETALVRSLEEAELQRALRAAATAFAEEVEQADPAAAARLRPMLHELA